MCPPCHYYLVDPWQTRGTFSTVDALKKDLMQTCLPRPHFSVQANKMPSDLPDYAALNETARGTAPGRGRLLGKRILVVAGGQRDIGHLPGVDPATIPPSNGRAISVLAGREGAAVAVHNRTVQSAEATAALVRAENDCPKAVAIPGDVTGGALHPAYRFNHRLIVLIMVF